MSQRIAFLALRATMYANERERSPSLPRETRRKMILSYEHKHLNLTSTYLVAAFRLVFPSPFPELSLLKRLISQHHVLLHDKLHLTGTNLTEDRANFIAKLVKIESSLIGFLFGHMHASFNFDELRRRLDVNVRYLTGPKSV